MSASSYDVDAVVVGSGPNGLAAAVRLAQEGLSVVVREANAVAGGGLSSEELTLPGFVHDTCSAVHPMGVLSPYLSTLPLDRHGLEWVSSDLSFAHPLDDGPAVLHWKDVSQTAEPLGPDARRYERLVRPFLKDLPGLIADALGPLKIPRRPIALARFGLLGALPARELARIAFEHAPARALLAGCAAHSILPLTRPLTGALGLMFLLLGHEAIWPVARGGSRTIAQALVSYLESLGGRVETGSPVDSISELPRSRVVLFDTSPRELVRVAGEHLPSPYKKRLARYRYGPGVFKVDWALDGPIPWRDSRCATASTVHVGGTLEEIAAGEKAAFQGRHTDRPFVMVCQQSDLDASRAPSGQRTGYAYCHVPHASTVDMTEAIESQIERFAPAFRDRILFRRTTTPAQLEATNRNCVGGVVAGGVADAFQLFTRPVARLDPYTTPNPRLLICSASTPPGGGVHGMCGYWAAMSALRRMR